MLKVLYLPTAQTVICGGEYDFSKEKMERYIQEPTVYFFIYNSSWVYMTHRPPDAPLGERVPKHLLEVIEV